MNIIKLKETDTGLLKEFKEKEWSETDEEHFGKKDIDFSRNTHTYVAINKSSKIIGYIVFILDMGVTHLESVMVGKENRGKGVAKQLIAKAEEIALSLGSHKIYLETGSDWEARKVYEHLGFSVRTTLPNYYAHRDFVLMDKELE